MSENVHLLDRDAEERQYPGIDTVELENDSDEWVQYVMPSGTKNITSTALTDVKEYENAQVVDANLIPQNIKNNVQILGVTGELTEGKRTGAALLVPFETPVIDDVRFLDDDCNVVLSVPLSEVSSLAALPEVPARTGFTSQGWNWSLASIQNVTHPVDVGANYITSDGKTKIEFADDMSSLFVGQTGTTTLKFRQSKSNGCKISVDGGTPYTVSGTGQVTSQSFSVTVGTLKTITLTPDSDCNICVLGVNSFQVTYSGTTLSVTPLVRISVGSNYSFETALSQTGSKYLNIPTGITAITIASQLGRRNVVIPRTVTTISNWYFYADFLSFPDTITTVSNYSGAQSIASNKNKRIIYPDGEISQLTYGTLAGLLYPKEYVYFPKNVSVLTVQISPMIRCGIHWPETDCMLKNCSVYGGAGSIVLPPNIYPNTTGTGYTFDYVRAYEVVWTCTSQRNDTFSGTLYNNPGLIRFVPPVYKEYTGYPGTQSDQVARVIIFPEGVEKISHGVVYEKSYNLQLIILPSTIKDVKGAWCRYDAYAYGPLAVVCLATTPPTDTNGGSGIMPNSNMQFLYVPDESVDAYKAAYTSPEFSVYADNILPLSAFPGGFDINNY